MQQSEARLGFFQEPGEHDIGFPSGTAMPPATGEPDHDTFLSNAFFGCWNQADEFALLSPEAEIELAQLVREGDEQAFQRMVCCNLRLVVSIARRCQRLAGPSLALADLVQEGVVGLMRAVRKFDHRLGYRFSTYATFWIRQAIMRAISDTGRTIRLPLHVIESLQRVEKVRVALTQTLEREPATAEIANHVGLPPERVQALREQAQDLTSLELMLLSEEGTLTLEDVLEDTEALSPLEYATNTIDRERFCATVHEAINQLPVRHAEILSLRYGLHGEAPMTLATIAKRLHITRERVRQIEREARNTLRQAENLRELFED